MRVLILILLLVSTSSFAQENAGPAATVDTNNPDNFKNSLIKEIVSIPVQKADSKSLLSWDKSLLQIGYGQSYHRFNPVDANENSISTYSDQGDDLNLRGQYYVFSFLSLLVDYEHTSYQVERFDGQPIQNKNRISRSLGYGIQFDLGDFILGFSNSTWNKPFYSLTSDTVSENEYSASVYTYKLGHRTGIKNFIIEFFYNYHNINSFKFNDSQDVTGKLQTIGIEVFTNSKKTFGLYFAESFGSLEYDSGSLEVKQFKIQPFFRF